MQGGSVCPEDEVHGGSGFEAEELQGSVACQSRASLPTFLSGQLQPWNAESSQIRPEAVEDYREATQIFDNDGEVRQASFSRANEAASA